MKVYHGTNVDLNIGEYLITQKAFNDVEYLKYVHLTDILEIAILYSINPIKSYCENRGISGKIRAFSQHINFNKTPIEICEIYKDMFNDLFNKPSFVYICEPKELTKFYCEHEYVSKEKCKIIDKICIENLLTKLKDLEKDGKIKLKYFDEMKENNNWNTLEDRIAGRAERCASECEYRFFKENFGKDLYIMEKIPKNFK